MISVVCFAILLALLLFYTIKKNKKNLLAISLVGLYCVSAITSSFVYINNLVYYKEVNLLSYLFLFLSLIIAFSPLIRFSPNRYKRMESFNISIINVFAFFLIILFLIGIIESIYTIINDFSRLLFDFSYANELYGDTRDVTSAQTGNSFLNVGAVLRGAFSEVLVLFTFYYMTLKQKSKLVLSLLLLSLLFPFLSSFTRGSRTVMVWWFIEMFIAFIILKDFYSESAKRWLQRVLMVITFVVVTIFTLLTIGRFNSNDYASMSANDSFVSYLGQGTLNFSDMVLQNDVHQYGDNCFPFFRSLVGFESSSNLYDRQWRWEGKMKIEQGVFYTFIGDLCNDFGSYFGLIFIIIFSIIFDRMINKKGKVVTLAQILSLFFFSCICFNGLFYFSYKSVGGNLRIIVYLILFCFIDIIP